MSSAGFAALPRAAVAGLRGSAIREVSELAAALPDDGRPPIPLWFGEAQAPAATYIAEAARAALARAEVFYTPNLGLPALREAIARELLALGRPVTPERVGVTSSGVSAVMLACQMMVEPGDRVVMIAPSWPNLTQIPSLLGASVETVPLHLRDGLWSLDLDRLLAALRPGTRMVLINAPANPTGWCIDADAQRAILDHCRRLGIWIIADDVYERLYFAADAAPSFLAIADAQDRLISVNSFSKAWSMTGYRLGWIVAPPSLMPHVARVIEYNTSCAPAFVQQAGIAALDAGPAPVRAMVGRYRDLRDLACDRLGAIDGIAAPRAEGGMYCFFSVAGCTDSLDLARRLLVEARVGLAPGIAFGPEGEGCLRLCFASEEARIAEACDRIADFMQAHPPR